jgi:hypothetical protein
MSETPQDPDPANVPGPVPGEALDELDGEELDSYIGEPVDPSEDPNIQEHHDG